MLLKIILCFRFSAILSIYVISSIKAYQDSPKKQRWLNIIIEAEESILSWQHKKTCVKFQVPGHLFGTPVKMQMGTPTLCVTVSVFEFTCGSSFLFLPRHMLRISSAGSSTWIPDTHVENPLAWLSPSCWHHLRSQPADRFVSVFETKIHFLKG